MSNKFEPVSWNEEMSVGIDIIDEDHKKLLGLLNEVDNIINAGTSSESESIESILFDLLDYTKNHFKREETLMKACDYPHLSEHKNAHETMLGQVNSYMNSFKAGSPSFNPVALRLFLEAWIVDHILKMDKDYVSWISGKDDIIENLLSHQ